MQNRIDRIVSHLGAFGVDVELDIHPAASAEDIADAERRLELSLPRAYVEFLSSFANGFSVEWRSDTGALSWFDMSPVRESVDQLLEMREWRFYSEDEAKEYGFPHVDDSQLAMTTNLVMHNWLPFHAEPNGDFFAIDLNSDRFGQIVFDRHDWLDGGTGQNGFPMEQTFPVFLESWASVCFSQPRSLFWKTVLSDCGVDWTSEQFDSRFRV